VLNQAFNLPVFARNMVAREHAVAKIQPTMPINFAALGGCGVMTGVGAAFNAAKLEPGRTVTVGGCGSIGLSVVDSAALAGPSRIIAIDTVASKLETANEIGTIETINVSNVDALGTVKEITEGASLPYCFEVLGLKTTAEQCSAMLRPGGVATIVGMIATGTAIEPRGAEFLGNRQMQRTGMGGNWFRVAMPRLPEPSRQSRLNLDMPISGTIKLQEINEAFAKLKPSAPAKQLMDFGVA